MISEIEENIFATRKDASDTESDPPSPPPSPHRVERGDSKPGFFSFAQVSIKLNELWSSARERVFGEDYWIPNDNYEVAYFPSELLQAHKTVYPSESTKSRIMLRVVSGSIKNTPDQPLYHVVYTFRYGQERESVSIFRSVDFGEAVDFCRKCEDCRILLKMTDKRKDVKKMIRDMTNQFQLHPLWRMVHIAIACNRTDVFTDNGLAYLKENGYTINEITKTVCSPEGKYPLMIAIETQQPGIVKFLLKNGADPADCDMLGNNALHYAALASVQMLEIVWDNGSAKPILNAVNNEHVSPVLLAIRNANPRCLTTLLGFGAELSLRATGKNPLFEAMQSRGKTTELIKEIVTASPNLLTDRDEATGNTALHAATYKNSLMSLLFLFGRHLDLNVRNKAGQTPLHIFTSRGDVGMIITLASYHCDMNAGNYNGDTALHIAVSHRYIEVTRLLLSLGADPNVVNRHGDSPRHMAAKLNEANLLKSLIICGASRCPRIKTGCVSGCVNKEANRVSVKNASIETYASPRSMADLERLENRTNFPSAGHWNFIQQHYQNLFYEELLEKLNTAATKKGITEQEFINILSLDGGGIRGLVIIQTLLEIERLMQEPIFKYFDWCVGTSTGGLVATGLTQGKTARQCQMVYLRFKDLIFDGWVRPYNSAVLESFIQREMGNATTMGDLRWPRLMFTTVRADVFPVQQEFIRNYRLPLTEEQNLELGFTDPDESLVWKALRCTSAAPTYFSNVDSKYIDGGIISNNPLLDLLAEIDLWKQTNNYIGIKNNVEVGCIFSIGTGVIPTIPFDISQMEISSNPYSAILAIKNLGVVIVDQVTATEGAPVNRALAWCSTSRTPFFRLSAPLFKDIAMDSKDDHELARMMWETVEYVYENKAYVEKMVSLLRKIGPSRHRRHLFSRKMNVHDMETQTSAPPTP